MYIKIPDILESALSNPLIRDPISQICPQTSSNLVASTDFRLQSPVNYRLKIIGTYTGYNYHCSCSGGKRGKFPCVDKVVRF